MARFNRVNLDGKSVTETRTAATGVGVLPGSAMVITDNHFAAPAGGSSVDKLYVANTGHLQRLTADDVIPVGDSIEGEYLETGRDIAVLVAPNTVLKKDSPISLSAAVPGYGRGLFTLAGTPGEDETGDRVVAFSQEDYTVGEAAELVWVRGA